MTLPAPDEVGHELQVGLRDERAVDAVEGAADVARFPLRHDDGAVLAEQLGAKDLLIRPGLVAQVPGRLAERISRNWLVSWLPTRAASPVALVVELATARADCALVPARGVTASP